MKRLFRIVTVIAAFSVIFPVCCYGMPASLAAKLAGKNNISSVHFVRLNDGRSLVDINSGKVLTPASTMKLVTVASILDTFTPAFTFKTRFYYQGRRQGDTIKGDLIVVGDGDPFIVSEKLWQLAADFSHLGIKKIEGDIVVDNTLFAGKARDASRIAGEKQSANAYDAPVSAFGVNFNTIAVALGPQAKLGSPGLVSLDPYPIRNVVIANRLKTTGTKSRSSFKVNRLSNRANTEIQVRGSVSMGSPLAKVHRSIDNHVGSAGEYLRAFLVGRGISVTGSVRAGQVTRSATLLYTLNSYPLAKIVSGLNKFSNNYIADVLTKRLGAEKPQTGAPRAKGSGSFVNGLQAMRTFLANKVRTTADFKLVNGSGLSTGNRLSARHLTDLMVYVYKRLELFPEFLASLPASGWDGTLKKRFKGPGANLLSGKVRAKTGTLTEPVSVSSLAGYVRHPKHGLVAFAIIQNGKLGKPQPPIQSLRASQDQILLEFVNSRNESHGRPNRKRLRKGSIGLP